MRTIAVRLTDGQDLLNEINGLLEKHDIAAGVILSAVGGLKQSIIRVPVIDENVQYINPQYVEINSLQGTVSKHGSHLHISVSDINGKTWGGHLKKGCIVWMCSELVIGILEDIVFNREFDKSTGYEELKISSQQATIPQIH